MSHRWLASPPETLLAELKSELLSPLPPAAIMQQVECVSVRDNGEKLVELPAHIASINGGYRELPIRTVPPRMMLRECVIDRLEQAQRMLPSGFTLCILDGWRSPEFQADLLAYYQDQTPKDDLDGFVSDPEHSRVVAPHTTGGAVDLTLAWQGKPLGLGTDWDAFTDTAAYLAYEPQQPGEVTERNPARGHAQAEPSAGSKLPEETERTHQAWGSPELVQGLRRTLSHALLQAGFAPLATEWWHWSYGEQQWAAFTGASESLYAQAQPGK